MIGAYITEADRGIDAASTSIPFSPESTMLFCRFLNRTARQTVFALALAAGLALLALGAAPAHAESGAHRKAAAPPVHTPVIVDERD